MGEEAERETRPSLVEINHVVCYNGIQWDTKSIGLGGKSMPHENRTEMIRLRMTPQEVQKLDAFAKSRGWTQSEAIRAAVTKIAGEEMMRTNLTHTLNDMGKLPNMDKTLEAINNISKLPNIDKTLEMIANIGKMPNMDSTMKALNQIDKTNEIINNIGKMPGTTGTKKSPK
jgi:Arc/MetJ-type ribon-helix-helix transcriptional regulator